MRQLDHPNIIKLIDFSESRQYYYIVLELCPGGELFHQIVRLTYFSEDLSRHVITQVSSPNHIGNGSSNIFVAACRASLGHTDLLLPGRKSIRILA